MDAAGFRAWVEQILSPTLVPGDNVIMDNLPAHTLTAVRGAIEARGSELCCRPTRPTSTPARWRSRRRRCLRRRCGALDRDALGRDCPSAATRPTQRLRRILTERWIRVIGKCSGTRTTIPKDAHRERPMTIGFNLPPDKRRGSRQSNLSGR